MNLDNAIIAGSSYSIYRESNEQYREENLLSVATASFVTY